MIDETAARDALISLFRSGVRHFKILVGVAEGMSFAGKKRLDIVNFFWRLMNASPPLMREEDLELLDDLFDCLLGHCRLEHIIRLHGDPENLKELSHLVAADAAIWKPPT